MAFALLLWQDKAFKGIIAAYPNPPPNLSIWFYTQGIAKPPLPISAQPGSFQQLPGPAVLIQSQSKALEVVLRNLDYSTAQTGNTGPFRTPTINGTWTYEPLSEANERLSQVVPDLAGWLRSHKP
jgi:hypothetical protein